MEVTTHNRRGRGARSRGPRGRARTAGPWPWARGSSPLPSLLCETAATGGAADAGVCGAGSKGSVCTSFTPGERSAGGSASYCTNLSTIGDASRGLSARGLVAISAVSLCGVPPLAAGDWTAASARGGPAKSGASVATSFCSALGVAEVLMGGRVSEVRSGSAGKSAAFGPAPCPATCAAKIGRTLHMDDGGSGGGELRMERGRHGRLSLRPSRGCYIPSAPTCTSVERRHG